MRGTGGCCAGAVQLQFWFSCVALANRRSAGMSVSYKRALLCQVFLDHPRLLVPTLQNQHSFRLPVQALHGIPQGACLKVSMATVGGWLR